VKEKQLKGEDISEEGMLELAAPIRENIKVIAAAEDPKKLLGL